MSTVEQAKSLFRCIDLAGESYCLGFGFADSPPGDAAYASIAKSHAAGGADESGAQSAAGLLEERLKLSDADRITVEQAEAEQAIAGVDKVKALNALLSDARQSRGSVGVMEPPAYPSGVRIMDGYQTRQECWDWCGPATIQAIDWADDGTKNSQADWASSDDLGTGSCNSGGSTSLTKIVEMINKWTAWDNAAGTYVVLYVNDWDWIDFFQVHASHLGDGSPAPIVEAPKLRNEYFKYLKYDHGGHFQTGRSYAGYGTFLDISTARIGILEPYNEADWRSDGNTTWGPRTVTADLLLKGVKANSDFQRIGL